MRAAFGEAARRMSYLAARGAAGLEPRVVQVGFVILQRRPLGERQGAAARLGEDQLSRRRIPLVSVGGAHVIVDGPFGQQTEL